MNELPAKITSLDPPMVTAEVEEPDICDPIYWQGITDDFYDPFANPSYDEAMQEYHKAIEPMPIENVIGNIICLEDCSNEWIKLNQKVLFIETETGCRVTKIS